MLQLAAAIALLIGHVDSAPMIATAWLDRDFIGALILVVAAFASASFYARLGTDAVLQRWTAVLLYGWGLCWWLGASWREVARHVDGSGKTAAAITLLALTAWVAAEVARRRPRFELGAVVAWTAPILLAAILPLVWRQLIDGQQPLWGWNLLANVLGAALGWRTLQCLRSWPSPALLTQLGWLWRWALVASVAIKLLLQGTAGMSAAWMLLLVMLPLCGLAALALIRPRWIAPPLVDLLPTLRPPPLGSVLFVLGLYWLAGLFMAGDATPMPYLPLLNPLELLLISIGLLFARWLGDATTTAPLRQRRAMHAGHARHGVRHQRRPARRAPAWPRAVERCPVRLEPGADVAHRGLERLRPAGLGVGFAPRPAAGLAGWRSDHGRGAGQVAAD